MELSALEINILKELVFFICIFLCGFIVGWITGKSEKEKNDGTSTE